MAAVERDLEAVAHQPQAAGIAALDRRDAEVVERERREVAAAGAQRESRASSSMPAARSGSSVSASIAPRCSDADASAAASPVGSRIATARSAHSSASTVSPAMNRWRDTRTRQCATATGSSSSLVQRGRRPSRVHRLAEAMGVVELPAVVVEHGRAFALAEPLQVGRTDSRCASACRCDPARAASRAAAGPTASTVSTSPASTAKCIRLARSGRSSCWSARRTARVQAPPRERRQAALDRAPRQLVAEAEMVRGDLEHPGELGLGERVDAVAEQVAGELEPDPRRHDRELLERLAAGRVEAARRGRAPPRPRWRDGVGRRGQHLGDEERVAAGDAVHGVGVGAGARRQPPHRRARERRQRQPAHRAPGQGAEQALQRMRRPSSSSRKVRTSTAGDRLDPPRHVAEHVDRRVVGPVDVLDDERGRRRGRELGQTA